MRRDGRLRAPRLPEIVIVKSTVAKTLLLLGMAVAFVANAPALASAAPTLVAVPAGTKVVLVPTGTGAFAALHNTSATRSISR